MAGKGKRRKKLRSLARRKKFDTEKVLNHISQCPPHDMQSGDNLMLRWELGPKSPGMVTTWQCHGCGLRYRYFAATGEVAYKGFGMFPIMTTVLDALAVSTA